MKQSKERRGWRPRKSDYLRYRDRGKWITSDEPRFDLNRRLELELIPPPLQALFPLPNPRFIASMSTWLSVPTELWLLILRQAMFIPWPEDDFFPPPYNRFTLDGFTEALPVFNDLVEAIANEYASCEVDIKKPIGEGLLRRVK